MPVTTLLRKQLINFRKYLKFLKFNKNYKRLIVLKRLRVINKLKELIIHPRTIVFRNLVKDLDGLTLIFMIRNTLNNRYKF